MADTINLTLHVWTQEGPQSKGRFTEVDAPDIPVTASFLEMLDIINERRIESHQSPFAFDHDCREGICGMCSLVIDGVAHGPEKATTTCQLHMRHYRDGDVIYVEPFRADAFPLVRDLVVNRSAFDKIIQAGGFISARTGSAVDANATPIGKEISDAAFEAAACIGCGACVAACRNASAMLFVSAKAGQLNSLPQGKPQKDRRVLGMVAAMDEAGFGNCSNQYECEAVCPKLIDRSWIARMNREYAVAAAKSTVGA